MVAMKRPKNPMAQPLSGAFPDNAPSAVRPSNANAAVSAGPNFKAMDASCGATAIKTSALITPPIVDPMVDKVTASEARPAKAIGRASNMVAAAIGWGIYSLVGRTVEDPLRDTAMNFLYASPVAVIVWLVLPDGLSLSGAVLAIVSGAVTSGLGYALWYALLPKLDSSVAALSQLTVPVIAVVGGAVLLAEAPGWRVVLASAVILGGVAFGILSQRKSGSKGS